MEPREDGAADKNLEYRNLDFLFGSSELLYLCTLAFLLVSKYEIYKQEGSIFGDRAIAPLFTPFLTSISSALSLQ
jgi:hypothetical protein